MQAKAADIGYNHNKSASYIRHLTRPSKLGIWNFTTDMKINVMWKTDYPCPVLGKTEDWLGRCELK